MNEKYPHETNGEQEFNHDLTQDEARRREHVMLALGEDWNPIEALKDEELANEILYSHLDLEQIKIYTELAQAGILPERSEEDLADTTKTSLNPYTELG